MRYRAEIDGLRALAVLPVIFFHADFGLFQGGFVGVDVFFVISGYLMTMIISDEMAAGRFSFVGFYERRVRRILPALFLVVLASIPFALMWMLPVELKLFSKSVVAINVFASNFIFALEHGYFSESSAVKPLIHTWSLAVEEQFYILFPVSYFCIRGWSRRGRIGAVLLVSLASLALAQWAGSWAPAYNFFLLPSRIWEFGAGVILALSAAHLPVARERAASGLLAQGGAALGAGMLLFAIVTFDAQMPFPSVWTLVPVLGASFVIACAGPGTLVGRVLSMRPLVGIGLISYSAYLWHQPLFALARIRSHTTPFPDWGFLLLSIVTLILAYFSWRFIEQPFRDRKRFSRRQVFVGAATVSVLLIAFGLAGYLTGGLPNRFEDSALARQSEALMEGNPGLSSACNGSLARPQCQTSSTPEAIVWGDSFAAHLVPGLLAADPKLPLIQATMGSCAPIPDYAMIETPYYPVSWAKDCQNFNRAVQAYIEKTPSLRVAVLSSPFHHYIAEDGAPRRLVLSGPEIVESNRALTELKFRENLAWLRSRNITPIIVSPTPQNGRRLERCAIRSLLWQGDGSECGFPLSEAEQRKKYLNQFMRSLARDYKVIFISAYLCQDGWCNVVGDGVPIYRDSSHLSTKGSIYLGHKKGLFDEVLRELGRTRSTLPPAPASH